MQFNSIIRSFLRTPAADEGNSMLFKSGQIFYGKLGKLFSGQYAEIWLGGQKLMAKIEAPLISGKGYWFQVSYSSGEIILKVLDKEHKPFNNNMQPNLSPHLLGLRDTKLHHKFTEFLMVEQLCFTKEEIQQGARFLSSIDDVEMAMQVLKMMNKKQLPFTDRIFKSLYAVSKETTPLSSSIGQLRQLLLAEETVSETAKSLLSLLDDWEMTAKRLEQRVDATTGRDVLLAKIKQSVTRLGLNYEAQLFHNQVEKETIGTLFKPLIVKLVQENSTQMNSSIQEVAEKVLLKMNGQQLLSISNHTIQTQLYEVPIQWGAEMKNLTIQCTGRKTDDGNFDADYCHIIFYLDLENLKSTVVNMQVQNRIVHLFIINDWQEIKEQAQSFIPILQAGLKELNYSLSGVRFKTSDARNKQTREYPFSNKASFDTGVDIRI
ncbi:hypothetical protein J8TS2_18490 [Lederbergia ruris]|uniref:Uncharacterized protein n=1 Tax=Lederbergia ruris TaxID=217495 RepID=A0ABQ4KHT7_9BACI|nr:hypothetical protein [Lederbergia ruris]GIN57530.1 hypothetical protein J8TS2_18490 [Lederbergia ruris]